jgi:hypothetical protein
MPRSQRMGSLSCFPGDGAREASSPLKTDSGSIQAGLGKELGVMDVLQESRITGREIEGYRQMTKEVHMNKQRMQRNRIPLNGTGTGSLQIDTDLANTLRQTSNSLTAPKSRMSFELKLDEEWEVNVKLVKGYCSQSSYVLMILIFPARYIFIRKFLTGQAASPLFAIVLRP